jgi:MoaA/NifB/PqqE/SkfB family radical SAM enzyme
MIGHAYLKAAHQINKLRFRPAMLAKIASGYFNTLVLRKTVLRVVDISINTACQSKCNYCYAESFKQSGAQLMTVKEIGEMWRQATAMGAFSALVLGGEPTLRQDFLDIISTLEPKKNLVTFTTNGISLTEEIVRELKRLGVFLVNISIDSTDPALNDRRRGYLGHFEAALKAVELCRKYGLDVCVPVVTSKSHLQETMKMIEFGKKHGFTVTMNLLSLQGRAKKERADQFDAEFWEALCELYAKNPGLRADFDLNFTMKVQCPAGYERVHIAPFGDVTGCSLQSVSFGNIREEPLADIVARMREFKHFKKRSSRCLIAMDDEYIEDYQMIASEQPVTPYPVTKIEALRQADGPKE